MTEAHAVAYTDLRIRVAALVGAVDPLELERRAPATPNWRVRDVVGHLVGIADDVVHGRLDGIASDLWTAAQVDKRRSVPIGELLGDWEQYGPRFEKLLADAPEEIAGQALFDGMTHEHDVRHAISRPGARDCDATALSWEWFVGVRNAGDTAAIRFVTEWGADVAGFGEPCVTVRAPRFELLRAMTGRRTLEEIAAYGWDPAPDPELLLAAAFFTIRTESLEE
jgi:hypothetical protein